jgi:DNA polymerase III epsilon subunit-like protein
MFKEEKRVNILVKPPIPIPYDSSQVHHIYDIDIKNKQDMANSMDEILSYINEPDLII